jgi:NitT/TauT family transport system substrate-binding protein
MTEKMYREKRGVAERVLKCFVEATKAFIDNPKLAEKYVRETMFKSQITSNDYQDAIANSPFTYDLTVAHIQVTTDLMQTYGVGRMTSPPAAKDWVKLDLLEKAKRELKIR